MSRYLNQLWRPFFFLEKIIQLEMHPGIGPMPKMCKGQGPPMLGKLLFGTQIAGQVLLSSDVAPLIEIFMSQNSSQLDNVDNN
jgi:hypothetical protein